jgi:hypothetical protein
MLREVSSVTMGQVGSYGRGLPKGNKYHSGRIVHRFVENDRLAWSCQVGRGAILECCIVDAAVLARSMITVDHEVLICVPPAEVFEFVTNAENDNAWVGFALSARRLSAAPIGCGTRFHQTGAILGMRIPLVWEITEFRPGEKMRGESVSGPAQFWGEYIFQEVPSGTRVRKMGKIQFGALLRMAEPLLAGIFQETLERDMENLKRLLEQRATHQMK